MICEILNPALQSIALIIAFGTELMRNWKTQAWQWSTVLHSSRNLCL